jgi:3-oxoacyl-(acyl-carrier-protein) synthase
MTSSLSKWLSWKHKNLSCSTATSVVSGPVKVVNGLQNSRKAHAFSYRRRLSSVVRLAGQIPTGWEAGHYGIPEDIVAQTDRASLWALVCTAEALNASGITDPYELYKHMHPSEVGTCIGSGMGGVTSMAQTFKDRRDEKQVQNDILQET